jgi:hypothetical protein
MTHSTDERRNQCHACLGACDGLGEAKEKGEVAVNSLVALELARSLDALPGRRDLDEHAFFLDSDGIVERDELSGLGLGSLLVEGETSVDFGGDPAGDDGEDLFAKFDELRSGGQGQVSGDALGGLSLSRY